MSTTEIADAKKSAEQYAEQLRNPSRSTPGGSLTELDLDVFLDLMLTQLQQQDPLDPMDNQEMLNTISQIREISSNDKLSSTLESVLLGQNVATAASLIGTEVEGLTDDGRRVIGAVQQIAINDGEPQLDLAVETSAGAGKVEGEIAEGDYTYVVTWEVDGEIFGVKTSVNTEDLGDDFQGSLRLDNLPKLAEDVPRKVYRTDAAGSARLIGSLPNGTTTTFTDTLSDKQLGAETLPERANLVVYADSVKVRLSNVGSIQTLR